MPLGQMQSAVSPGDLDQYSVSGALSHRSSDCAQASDPPAPDGAGFTMPERQLWLQPLQHIHPPGHHPQQPLHQGNYQLLHQQYVATSTSTPVCGQYDRSLASQAAPMEVQLQIHPTSHVSPAAGVALAPPLHPVATAVPNVASTAVYQPHPLQQAPVQPAQTLEVKDYLPRTTATPMGLLERLTQWQQQQQWLQQQQQEVKGGQPSSSVTCESGDLPLQPPPHQQLPVTAPRTRTAAAAAFIRQQTPSTLAHMALTISSRALHAAMLALRKTSVTTSACHATSAPAVAMSIVSPTAAEHARSAGYATSAPLDATSASDLAAQQHDQHLTEAESALDAAARRLGMARTFAAAAMRTDAQPGHRSYTPGRTAGRAHLLQQHQQQQRHRLPVRVNTQQSKERRAERRQRAKQRLKEIFRDQIRYRITMQVRRTQQQQQQDGQAAAPTAVEDGEEVSSRLRAADR